MHSEVSVVRNSLQRVNFLSSALPVQSYVISVSYFSLWTRTFIPAVIAIETQISMRVHNGLAVFSRLKKNALPMHVHTVRNAIYR